MLDKIKKTFDDFTFHARVMPSLVVCIPFLLLGIFKGIIEDNIASNTLYVMVMIIFISFVARIARNQGKKYEEKMFEKLGGKPTTIILRYSNKNNGIDDITKKRYHMNLNRRVEGVSLPLDSNSETIESDKHYESAMNWLRVYANSNRDKEPRVYQELKEYNYLRNLYGLKNIAVVIYFFTALREISLMESFNIKDIFSKPYPQYMAFLLMIVSIILFIFFVSKLAVEKKAFDYAKTLAEVCERI